MQAKCKSCGSCGMPLEKPDDFALADTAAQFCRYCTDKKGQLLPFEKILSMNANHYVESQGVTPDSALKMATDLLASQPAWKGHRQ